MKSAGKADWFPLQGRALTVWPDADAAGHEYARQVAKLATAAGALSVAFVSPPPNCKIGWDAGDALAEGWNDTRAMGLMNAAEPAAPEVSNTQRHSRSMTLPVPGGVRRSEIR